MAEHEKEDVAFEEMEGHEVFVPPSRIKPSRAATLMSLMSGVSDGKGGDGVDFVAMSALLEELENGYLEDEQGYQRLYAEKGFAYVARLVVAYVGEAVGAGR